MGQSHSENLRSFQNAYQQLETKNDGYFGLHHIL